MTSNKISNDIFILAFSFIEFVSGSFSIIYFNFYTARFAFKKNAQHIMYSYHTQCFLEQVQFSKHRQMRVSNVLG